MGQLDVLWIDENVFNSENQVTAKILENISKSVHQFTDIDGVMRLIGRYENNYVPNIIIVSGELAGDFLAKIKEYRCILSVYIYCRDAWRAKQYSDKYSRVKIVTDTVELIDGIKAEQASFNKK